MANKGFLISGITFLLILLAFSACDRREVKIPTNPSDVSTDDAKQILTFLCDDTTLKSNDYNIVLMSTRHGYNQAYEDDSVYVIIDTTRYNLSYQGASAPYWTSDQSIRLTGSHMVKLIYNNHQMLKTNIRAIYPASANFPVHYDYTRPFTLNWGKEGSNEYQFAIAESFFPDSNIPNSRFERALGNSAGSFAFPANCIAPVVDTTYTSPYRFGIEQVNFKIVDNIAVMLMHNEFETYHSDGKGFLTGQTQRILNVYKRLKNK